MKPQINNSVRGAALSLGVDANLLYELLPSLRAGVNLAAENERLRKASFTTAVPSEDYAAIAAENERLRKAGDTVVAAYCMGDWDTERWKEYPVVAQWLAAKEGRDAK